MEETSGSSLVEIEPLSLNELMDKDPSTLTKEEKSQIYAEFRKGRTIWRQEDVAAKTQGRRVKTSQGQKGASLTELKVDLSDLGDI